jgi:hypothetical protein
MRHQQFAYFHGQDCSDNDPRSAETIELSLQALGFLAMTFGSVCIGDSR